MKFNDEKKQAEFEQFKAFYLLISQPPNTLHNRSHLNQLRTFAIARYGNGGFQDILREVKISVPEPNTEPKLAGKSTGGSSSSRRNQPPEARPAIPGTKRWERQQLRGAQESKSVQNPVVAANATAKDLANVTENLSKPGFTAQEMPNPAFEQYGRNPLKDAEAFSWKELTEKYSESELYEASLSAGSTFEELEGKTARQLANILKKKAGE